MWPKLLGALIASSAGVAGLAIPIDFGFQSTAHHSSKSPVLPQILLPLLGAGNGGAAAPSCGSPVISLVQQNDAQSGGCTTCTATLASGPASGDMVLLATTGQHTSTDSTVSSVSSTNTAWAKDANQVVIGTNHADTELWHGLVSGGTGGTSVTVTWSQGLTSNSFTYTIQEWSGTVTSSPADGATVINTGANTNSPTTGAYSTGATCELIMVVQGDALNGGVNVFPGAPYTNLNQPNGASNASYNVSSPMGSQTTATWTLNGNRNWVTFIQGYKHL